MSVLDPFVTRVKTDLDGVLQMTQMLNGIMMTGDSRANQIIVDLYNRNGRVRLDPSSFEPVGENKVVGYFIRGDGYTVEIDGSITENGEPTVIVPRAAYESTGALSIAIRILSDRQVIPIIDPETGEPTGDSKIEWNSKTVVAALSCFVQNTETDSIIDPDHKIPDVQELLAYIDALEHQYNTFAEQEYERVVADQERTEKTNRIVNSIDNMTVSASGLAAGSNPTAAISEVNSHKHIAFGIPKGDKGDNAYVDHVVYEYAVGNNSYDIPTTWYENIPTVPQGKYLWTKSTVYFQPTGSAVSYSIARQGIDANGGTVKTVQGVSPDSEGNVQVMRISGTRLIIG